MIKVFLFFIKFYQKAISPFLGRNCRFYPTCSEYAYLSIKKYRTKGILKAIKRLLSCHPFNKGGYNPLS